MVYLHAFSSEEQCDVAFLHSLPKRLAGGRIFLEFQTIALAKLRPFGRVMVKPLPQFRAGCDILQPNHGSKRAFFDAARPKTVHEKSKSIVRRRLLINPLDVELVSPAVPGGTGVFGFDRNARHSENRKMSGWTARRRGSSENALEPTSNFMGQPNHLLRLGLFEMAGTIETP